MDARSRIAVCSVAGSDPTGGAGLQGDLKTFAAHAVYGTAVVTALTVQGRRGVRRVVPVAPDVVAEQLAVVLDEVRPRAVKTGMLWDGGVVRAVADLLAAARERPLLVVDPVLVASAGGDLLREDALPVLRDRLLPLADVLTPNLPEAERLLGRRVEEGEEDEAARAILALGGRAVVLKGGHGGGNDAVDVLATKDAVVRFALPRVRGAYGHGTGCAFAAALAANLARGLDLRTAVERAKAYVHRALSAAAAIGPDAPLDHGV